MRKVMCGIALTAVVGTFALMTGCGGKQQLV